MGSLSGFVSAADAMAKCLNVVERSMPRLGDGAALKGVKVGGDYGAVSDGNFGKFDEWRMRDQLSRTGEM